MMRFEYLVRIDSGLQYKILLTEQNEICRVLSIDQRELIAPCELADKLFFCRVEGVEFRSYLWICSDLKLVYFERQELEDFFHDKKITHELLVKLGTKENIERYLSLMRL